MRSVGRAGTDYGLRAVCVRAGLSWAEVAAALGDPAVEQQWRKITADNAEEIFARGASRFLGGWMSVWVGEWVDAGCCCAQDGLGFV